MNREDQTEGLLMGYVQTPPVAALSRAQNCTGMTNDGMSNDERMTKRGSLPVAAAKICLLEKAATSERGPVAALSRAQICLLEKAGVGMTNDGMSNDEKMTKPGSLPVAAVSRAQICTGMTNDGMSNDERMTKPESLPVAAFSRAQICLLEKAATSERGPAAAVSRAQICLLEKAATSERGPAAAVSRAQICLLEKAATSERGLVAALSRAQICLLEKAATCQFFIALGLLVLLTGCMPHEHPPAPHAQRFKPAPAPIPDAPRLTDAHVANQSRGCTTCHTSTDATSMHASESVSLGCADCHGGNPTQGIENGPYDPANAVHVAAKKRAHVPPHDHDHFVDAANPPGNPAKLNAETWEFVRFINPGDLRVADITCGGCHQNEVDAVRKSMMTTGAMLWSAALYNNGSFPYKRAHFGESYSRAGEPQMIRTVPEPTEDDLAKGVLPFLMPLPRFEVGQPSNVLRVFERGGRFPNLLAGGLSEVNQPIPPNQDDEPGRPEQNRLSPRGYGTLNRIDPVWLNLHKTRLLDPTLNHLGTNDRPGEYRSSGCSACHVLYANDPDPMHAEFTDALNSDRTWNSREGSGPVAGNRGTTFTSDPTIPKDQSGHPIKHVFTRAIPTSQCITCHIHPGTTVTNSYLGYTWWDNESHGDLLYPKNEVKADPAGKHEAARLGSNPEGSAVRGDWGKADFFNTEKVAALNSKVGNRMNPTKFSNFHGHGWLFRAVYKKDRKGNFLDQDNKHIDMTSADKLADAVQLRDIHLEKGMHCTDCHFSGDSHGNGKLYGATRDAVEVDCADCHGTPSQRATLLTSGPAAPDGGTDLQKTKTPWRGRFRITDGKVTQYSSVVKGRKWEVPQVADINNPAHESFNERATLAHTIARDGTWGDPTVATSELAHGNDRMACMSCHTAWVTSCFGCHLPMKANRRRESLHFEGKTTRNWTSYSMMTVRDDVFMLAKDGDVQKNRVSPARSTCAVIVGSQTGNREWVYSQQQTVSSPGFSGHAFATHVPHTVRGKETKTCTDCHVSKNEDNNAIMAQVLMQGTNAYNFMGRYVYVAVGEKGVDAVVVTEQDEPQAVIGSTLHKDAFPDQYRKFVDGGRILRDSFGHGAGGPFRFLKKGFIRNVQHRGEYLYLASGKRGLQVFDIANIDNKGFSQRITSAPVSPVGGQRLHVNTVDAAWVASPSTLAVDPSRNTELLKQNREQSIHPLFGYLYIADRKEGLILVGAGTLLDGNPLNNFLQRTITFNPGGQLDGAHHVTIVGNYAYVLTQTSLVVVDINEPESPQITATVTSPLNAPVTLAVQFRYAFVVDASGVQVLDVTALASPNPVENGRVEIAGASSIYLVRTWAYVAAGEQGIAIVDIERPRAPALWKMFDADGTMNDVRDVKIGITNNSHFAYVADGANGLRVIQLTSPYHTPGIGGFSPQPTPKLIATFPTRGPALGISEGVDRDRGVDESGNQISVFNRIGSRPFNIEEMQRMYLKDGKVRYVTDDLDSYQAQRKQFKAPETEAEEESDEDDLEF